MIQASQYNSSITATYKIPGNHPASQENLFGVAFGHIEQDTGTSDVQKVSYSYVTKKRQWHRIISLSALDEDYNITDIPKTDARMIFPSINWSRRKANSTLNPSNGLSTTINLNGTPYFLSSKDTGFSQIRIDTNFLKSFKENSFRILIRNSIGRTEIEDLSELPLSLQLFAGGSRSIRGYGYNSIGPGDNLVTGTFEVQRALPRSTSWYFTSFIDAGNVTDNDIRDDMKSSTGFGLAWLSPLGMMELDLAFPIPKEDQGVHVSFSMGPTL